MSALAGKTKFEAIESIKRDFHSLAAAVDRSDKTFYVCFHESTVV